MAPQCTFQLFLSRTGTEATWLGDAAGLFAHECDEDALTFRGYSSSCGRTIFGIGRANSIRLLHPPTAHFLAAPSHESSSSTVTTPASPSDAFSTDKVGEGRRNAPWLLISIVVIALLLILSLVTLLLTYVLSGNQSLWSNGTLQTTADLPYILAASQLISTAMSLAIAPIMGLHAFRVAALWVDDLQLFEAPLPSE